MKLVAEVGVGTVAAGVAKCNADHVLISGHDGGTGSIARLVDPACGRPVGDRSRRDAADARLKRLALAHLGADGRAVEDGTRRDVAALLGADEMGFATAPLIATGCVMMRACHLNTCPVGIATQDPELRKRFRGKPEHVIEFLFHVAEDARRIMASLGVARFEDLVGRVDLLEPDDALEHWQARGIDLSNLLQRARSPGRHAASPRRGAGLAASRRARLASDRRCRAGARGRRGRASCIRRAQRRPHDRRLLSHSVTKRYGRAGLPAGDDPLRPRGLGRSVVRSVARAGDRADADRRGERLCRQGPLRRHDRDPAAARCDVRRARRT